MSASTVAILYLISALLFIFALKGLSHPESSRRGNIFGIVGMIIAIITTLMFKSVLSYSEIGVAILIGGLIGTFIALKIEMTALPQLVAAFHSLVGLAAVFVAGAAFYDPASFNIGDFGSIPSSSLVEMSIGMLIGAVTFSGSVLAFVKLQGIISGKPIVFKFQHLINALTQAGIKPTSSVANTGPLSGKTFLITGTLPESRQSLEQKIIAVKYLIQSV